MNNAVQGTNSLRFEETRSEAIFRHTHQMFHDLRISWQAFGAQVVEIYHQRVPEEARQVQFSTSDDIFRRATINAQKLKRYQDAEIEARLPVDLEEAWVLALPDPYRSACVRDLALRYGLLAVPLPGVSVAGDMQSVARLSREFGEAMASLSAMYSDGRLTAADAEHAQYAMDHLLGLMSQAESLRERLQAVCGAAAQAAPRRSRRGR